MKIRPYIAIDLETTGLGPKSEMLQLAAILDDGFSPIDELEKINFIIKKKFYSYGEAYALGMNAWIFQEIKKHLDREETKIPVENFNTVMQAFSMMIVKCSMNAIAFDIDTGIKKDPTARDNRKIQMAGKNVGTFDWKKIEFECEANSFTLPNMIQHRGIDIGSLYYNDFGYNPSLDEINNLIGRKAVSHDALDDAYDVVYAIRNKMGDINGK